jgi:hypothetical protein
LISFDYSFDHFLFFAAGCTRAAIFISYFYFFRLCEVNMINTFIWIDWQFLDEVKILLRNLIHGGFFYLYHPLNYCTITSMRMNNHSFYVFSSQILLTLMFFVRKISTQALSIF